MRPTATDYVHSMEGLVYLLNHPQVNKDPIVSVGTPIASEMIASSNLVEEDSIENELDNGRQLYDMNEKNEEVDRSNESLDESHTICKQIKEESKVLNESSNRVLECEVGDTIDDKRVDDGLIVANVMDEVVTAAVNEENGGELVGTKTEEEGVSLHMDGTVDKQMEVSPVIINSTTDVNQTNVVDGIDVSVDKDVLNDETRYSNAQLISTRNACDLNKKFIDLSSAVAIGLREASNVTARMPQAMGDTQYTILQLLSVHKSDVPNNKEEHIFPKLEKAHRLARQDRAGGYHNRRTNRNEGQVSYKGNPPSSENSTLPPYTNYSSPPYSYYTPSVVSTLPPSTRSVPPYTNPSSRPSSSIIGSPTIPMATASPTSSSSSVLMSPGNTGLMRSPPITVGSPYRVLRGLNSPGLLGKLPQTPSSPTSTVFQFRLDASNNHSFNNGNKKNPYSPPGSPLVEGKEMHGMGRGGSKAQHDKSNGACKGGGNSRQINEGNKGDGFYISETLDALKNILQQPLDERDGKPSSTTQVETKTILENSTNERAASDLRSKHVGNDSNIKGGKTEMGSSLTSTERMDELEQCVWDAPDIDLKQAGGMKIFSLGNIRLAEESEARGIPMKTYLEEQTRSMKAMQDREGENGGKSDTSKNEILGREWSDAYASLHINSCDGSINNSKDMFDKSYASIAAGSETFEFAEDGSGEVELQNSQFAQLFKNLNSAGTEQKKNTVNAEQPGVYASVNDGINHLARGATTASATQVHTHNRAGFHGDAGGASKQSEGVSDGREAGRRLMAMLGVKGCSDEVKQSSQPSTLKDSAVETSGSRSPGGVTRKISVQEFFFPNGFNATDDINGDEKHFNSMQQTRLDARNMHGAPTPSASATVRGDAIDTQGRLESGSSTSFKSEWDSVAALLSRSANQLRTPFNQTSANSFKEPFSDSSLLQKRRERMHGGVDLSALTGGSTGLFPSFSDDPHPPPYPPADEKRCSVQPWDTKEVHGDSTSPAMKQSNLRSAFFPSDNTSHPERYSSQSNATLDSQNYNTSTHSSASKRNDNFESMAEMPSREYVTNALLQYLASHSSSSMKQPKGVHASDGTPSMEPQFSIPHQMSYMQHTQPHPPSTAFQTYQRNGLDAYHNFNSKPQRMQPPTHQQQPYGYNTIYNTKQQQCSNPSSYMMMQSNVMDSQYRGSDSTQR